MTPSDDRNRAFGRRADLHRITITHGDRVRAFHVDTGRMMAIGLVVGVFGLAYLGATAYLFFRDDILTGSISRQLHQERAYADRVAALRAEIDRINGRQLIDQDAFEAKIDKLLERQVRLGETQAKIGGLIAKVGELGIDVQAAGKMPSLAPIGTPLAPPAAAQPAAPAPLDTDRFATPLRSSRASPFSTPAMAADARDPIARIAGVERAIDSFEKRQTAGLAGLADLAEGRARNWGRALAKIGFRVGEPTSPMPQARPNGEAVGGPFVPAADPVSRIDAALARLATIRSTARRLPLARPLPGDPTITSEFGSRTDPFLGVGAMHTGIDFRAETGEPVRVTGPGVVTASGRQGGYGLCVDVDHGNGVITRYGHMSSLSVSVGDRVRGGDVVGLAGSTGRSTGPHLHYETRVAGEAVDPADWLAAGRALGF